MAADAGQQREVREETGLEIEIVSPKGVARQFVPWQGDWYNKIGHYFVCRPVGEGEADDALLGHTSGVEGELTRGGRRVVRAHDRNRPFWSDDDAA